MSIYCESDIILVTWDKVEISSYVALHHGVHDLVWEPDNEHMERTKADKVPTWASHTP